MTITLKTKVYSRINASSDDAYQAGTTVNISTITLNHANTGDLIGLRFINIGVPKGATITRAVLRYEIGGGGGNPNLQIHCQKTANPGTFTIANNDISVRPLTDASTYYQGTNLPSGVAYSPDFSAAVQEVIDLPDWSSGNALAVILKSNANTTYLVRTRDGDAYVRATIIIEYTMPPPLTPSIHSVFNTSVGNAATRSLSVPIPTARGTRLYAFVHTTRTSSDYDGNVHDVSSVTLNGEPMTLIDVQASHVTKSHYHILALYEAIDPLDNGGAPPLQTLTATLSKSALAIGISAVIVTDVAERGGVTKMASVGQTTDIAFDVVTSLYPGLILAGGHVTRKNTSLEYLHATDDAGAIVQYQTGTSINDLDIFLGAAGASEPATYRVGWNWTSVEWDPGGANARIMALPLYGSAEVAGAGFAAIDPEVIYGDVTMDGVSAAAEFAAADPTVILGSIPPVQVSGRGALFISTVSHTITVCLLATNDDDWVITDSGGNVEQLSLHIIRRAGYLTPV